MNPNSDDPCMLCGHGRASHNSGTNCRVCNCVIFAQRVMDPLEIEYAETYQCILGFTFNGDHWRGEPRDMFKPIGLAVWGCPAGSTIAACHCGGHKDQLLASYAPIPARFFGNFRSFQQLKAMIEAGEEPFATWGSFRSVMPGQMVRVMINDASGKGIGPEGIELAMWGKALKSTG